MEKNQIQQYIDSQEHKLDVERAKKRFQFKSFTERFRPIFKLAKILRIVLPFISSAATIAFLYEHIFDLFEIMVISAMLSTAGASLWEWGKAKVIEIASELLYIGNYGAGVITAIIALVAQLGSTYAAIEGAKYIYAMRDDRVQVVKSHLSIERDSVERYWDSKIDSAKAFAEGYKADNLILDASRKVVLRAGSATKQYQTLIADVQLVEADKRDALKRFDSDADKTTEEAVQKSGKATKNVKWFTIIIELLILAANWFIVHYDYKTHWLEYLLTHEEEKLHEFKSFAQLYYLHKTSPMLMKGGTMNIGSGQGKTQIGFHASKNAGPSSAHASSLDPSLMASLNQALAGLPAQEISRIIQEMQRLTQAQGPVFSPSQGQALTAVERAIQAGLLEELRLMKANGQKMAYQDITARYGISIPQIQEVKKLYKI
jgi:hypothetical protein